MTHSDSAVKQILLTLDERPGQSFIIEDLDEFHLLIRSDEEQRVKRELEAEVCSLFWGNLCSFPEMGMRNFSAVGEEHVQHGSLDILYNRQEATAATDIHRVFLEFSAADPPNVPPLCGSCG
jgi:TFIIH basal transcription factor complex TTD-A subunit